jgi:hypothetical protein
LTAFEKEVTSTGKHHKKTHDIKYSNINVKLVLVLDFLCTMKRKPDGTFYGRGHVRKLHDAIIFGAEEANLLLPEMYLEKVQQYLDSYRKEWAAAMYDCADVYV